MTRSPPPHWGTPGGWRTSTQPPFDTIYAAIEWGKRPAQSPTPDRRAVEVPFFINLALVHTDPPDALRTVCDTESGPADDLRRTLADLRQHLAGRYGPPGEVSPGGAIVAQWRALVQAQPPAPPG